MSARYRGRVRTGCLACRAAKVKCDEHRPVCKRCIRQHKECVYTRKRPPAESAALITPEAKVRDAPSPSGTTPWTATAAASPQLTLQHSIKPYRSYGSPISTGSYSHQDLSGPSTTASPSLLSTLVSQDIYLCTTIDYIGATEGRPSYIYFHQNFDCPFITPYAPANWIDFKEKVLESVSHNRSLATATQAAQAVHRARKNSLTHVRPLKVYKEACELCEAEISREAVDDEDMDSLFTTAFLLLLVEMMLPEETSPGLLCQSSNSFSGALRTHVIAALPPSPLFARLAAWFLICHAAARRSGNRGLLSPFVLDLLKTAFNQRTSIPPLESVRPGSPANTLLATLTEPVFSAYVQTQILSAEVAELSHYHRRRTTGADQEEVTDLMSVLRSQLDDLWHCRPTLVRHGQGELRSRFTSSRIADALELLCTLFILTFDTEIVEMGRNLSQEQSTTPEASTRLKNMKSIISSWMYENKDLGVHPAFLRALLLCAIESTDSEDSDWAIAMMRNINDPICYSEFFANFSEGLADMQRRMGRRVTTRWFGLQTFGVALPFL